LRERDGELGRQEEIVRERGRQQGEEGRMQGRTEGRNAEGRKREGGS